MYHIDKKIYKNLKDKQFIVVDGYCFTLDNKNITYEVLLNDENVSFDYVAMDRNDIYSRLDEKPVNRKFGFHITVTCTNEKVNTFKIYACIEDKKEELLSLTSRDLKDIETTKAIDYCIDSYVQDEYSTEIVGWAFSNYDEDISYEIVNKRQEIVESTQRLIPRMDLVALHLIDEEHSNAGFKIKFDSKEKEQYYLLIKSNKETKKVKLYQNDGSLSAKCKACFKQVNFMTLKRAMRYLKKHGVKQFARRLNQATLPPVSTVDYQEWFFDQRVTPSEIKEQVKTEFAYNPKISIIVATFNTKDRYLKDMIDTVVKQTYSNWELCIADGSSSDCVKKYIEKNYQLNDKLKYVQLDQNYGIAGNMNKALELVTGDYVGLYDHDDFFELDCFYEIVKKLQEKQYDFIYTDEDKYLDSTKKFVDPHFKSDFNMDLLCNVNYICHFLCVKKSLIDKVGVLRKEFDGAQDFDFVLRLSEATTPDNIYHIPRILYHWRMHELSTAENPESKMYAFEAGKRAVQAHYDRLKIAAKVTMGEGLGLYRTQFEVIGEPLISILIPNKDHIDDLKRCIDSIEKKSSYKNYEYIIIENNSTEKETFEYYKKLEAQNNKVKVVYWDGIFNYSAINNFGAKYARGEYYLLLNNDTEIMNSDCLKELLGYCQREDVGAVGARLYYHDDTIQHAGVVVGAGGIAGHAFVGERRGALGYFGRIVASQDLSAVTAACMMVKKSVFEQVGGLSESLKVAFNDIDFCIKIRKAGYLVVYNPYAELYHYESKSRGQEDSLEKMERFNSEVETFRMKWPEILKDGDPYYNVNLSLMNTPYTIKPKAEK